MSLREKETYESEKFNEMIRFRQLATHYLHVQSSMKFFFHQFEHQLRHMTLDVDIVSKFTNDLAHRMTLAMFALKRVFLVLVEVDVCPCPAVTGVVLDMSGFGS